MDTRQIFALAVEHEQLKRRVAVLEQALARLAPDLFDEFAAATSSTSASYAMHQLPAMTLPVPPPLNPPKGSNRPRTRRKRGEADEDAEERDQDEMDSDEEGSGGDDEEEEEEGDQDEYETDNEVVEGAAHALKGLGTSEKTSFVPTHRTAKGWAGSEHPSRRRASARFF